MSETEHQQSQRGLLGLRPPADLAEGTVPVNTPVATAMPERPSYPVISSGWDDEDEGKSKGSDFGAALRAGAVLLIAMVAVGLLLR